MKIEDIRRILGHFDGAVFPRTISTKATQGKQIVVADIDEIYSRFNEANFVDCRINAYPVFTNYKGVNRQAPNFVMCDIDITKFRTEKLLLKTLQLSSIINKIRYISMIYMIYMIFEESKIQG